MEYDQMQQDISHKLSRIIYLLENQSLLTQTTKAGEGTSLDVKNTEGYSEDDLMKAFEAARETAGSYAPYPHPQYPTFQDYKESL